MTHFAVAKSMGISDEELDETIQLAASVAAGSIVSIAKRARKVADNESRLLRKEGHA